jgi:heme a synthase
MEGLRKLSFFTLVYTVAVVVWGAFVRATGSGAGCGSHWPLCNGEVIPKAESVKTWIEFAHRASSGANLILVAVLYFCVRRIAEKKSWLRNAAFCSWVAILIEAAVGAGLVLLEWVGIDRSVGRTISIAIHLVTTSFLVASLTSVWWGSRVGGALLRPSSGRHVSRDSEFMGAAVLFVLVGMMGAITALGDTLFPAATWAEGIAQHGDAKRHFLVSMRVIHPTLAVVFVVVAFQWADRLRRAGNALGRAVMGLLFLQLGLGLVNLLLLAPTTMQLLHLFVANLLWIVLWRSGLKVDAA